MPGLKLYDIPQEIAAFEMELTSTEGEVTPELEARWKEFISAGKDKVEGAAMVVRTLEAQAAACKTEADRLSRMAKSHQANVDRLKGLMVYAVDALGGKVKTALFNIYTQSSKAGKRVEVAEGANLELLETACPQFVRVKREIDKEAVLAAFEAGEEIPDALRIEESAATRFLQIR